MKEINHKTPKYLDATETSCCFICCKALLKNLTSYFAPVKVINKIVKMYICSLGWGKSDNIKFSGTLLEKIL